MAVYTIVSDSDLISFLSNYDCGTLVKKLPIAEGVENTNYLLETTCGKYILTLFEKRVKKADLPFFIGLTEYLSRQNLPVAKPIANKSNAYIGALSGKPAVMVAFLPGKAVTSPDKNHCKAIGTILACLHNSVASFKPQRENPLSVSGWRKLGHACNHDTDKYSPELRTFIKNELREISDRWPVNLPSGVVHTDLFPDNILFEQDEITGVIDFYFSCTDFFAYDLAVCINAWCFDDSQQFNIDNAKSLISSYLAIRPLSEVEMASFQILLRGAGLRFLLTRLYDWLNQVDGAVVTVKDPLEFYAITLFHRDHYSPKLYGFDL